MCFICSCALGLSLRLFMISDRYTLYIPIISANCFCVIFLLNNSERTFAPNSSGILIPSFHLALTPKNQYLKSWRDLLALLPIVFDRSWQAPLVQILVLGCECF